MFMTDSSRTGKGRDRTDATDNYLLSGTACQWTCRDVRERGRRLALPRRPPVAPGARSSQPRFSGSGRRPKLRSLSNPNHGFARIQAGTTSSVASFRHPGGFRRTGQGRHCARRRRLQGHASASGWTRRRVIGASPCAMLVIGALGGTVAMRHRRRRARTRAGEAPSRHARIHAGRPGAGRGEAAARWLPCFGHRAAGPPGAPSRPRCPATCARSRSAKANRFSPVSCSRASIRPTSNRG